MTGLDLYFFRHQPVGLVTLKSYQPEIVFNLPINRDLLDFWGKKCLLSGCCLSNFITAHHENPPLLASGRVALGEQSCLPVKIWVTFVSLKMGWFHFFWSLIPTQKIGTVEIMMLECLQYWDETLYIYLEHNICCMHFITLKQPL